MQQPDNPDRRKLLKTAAAVSAAAALTACGQGGQSAQTASSPEGKAAADCSGNGSHSQTSYDCYGVHQAGITTPHQTFGILCAFDVTVSDISQLINYFRTLTARIEFLTKGGELVDGDEKLPPTGSGLLGKTVPPDGLTVTVSVGASLFDARFGLGGKKPKHLQEMKDFPNDKLQKEWCDGDIGIQICAFSPETCQNALRDIIKNTAKYAITRWSLDGWLPKAEPGAIASVRPTPTSASLKSPTKYCGRVWLPTVWTNRHGRKTAAIRPYASSVILSNFGTGRPCRSNRPFSAAKNTAARP